MNKISIRQSLKIVSNDIQLLLLLIAYIGFLFLGNQRYTWLLLDVFVLSMIYKKNIEIKLSSRAIFFFIILLTAIFTANICLFGFSIIGFLKAYYYLRPIILTIFFIGLLKNNIEKAKVFFYLIFIVSLLQFFINIYFILSEYNINPSDIDNNNGLFGYGASHFSGLVWLYIVLYQLIFNKRVIFLIIEVIIMLYLAMLTENKFFYLFLGVVFLLKIFKNVKFQLFLKNIIIIFFSLSLIYIVSKKIPTINNFFEKKIINTATNLFDINKNSKDIERSSILLKTLKFSNVWYFGSGSGAVSDILGFHGKNIKIFTHINMNDINILLYEFGIVFYFSYLVVCALFINKLFIKNNYYRFVIILIFLFIFTYYARLFSDPRLFLMFLFSFGLLAVDYNSKLLIRNE